MAKQMAWFQESIENPHGFWSAILDAFHWHKHPSEENFLKYNFDINEGPIFIEWMKDAKLNICYNALDRHIEKRGNQVRNTTHPKAFFHFALHEILMPIQNNSKNDIMNSLVERSAQC